MRVLRRKDQALEIIEQLIKNQSGISIRKLLVQERDLYIFFLDELTDSDKLSQSIIKPLMQYHGEYPLTIDRIASSVIFIDDVTFDEDDEQLVEHILTGQAVIFLPEETKYLIVNTLKIEKRGVEAPEVQNALRGPKDSFTENFQTNLSLIRYRVKDPSLVINKFIIGERTRTAVAVIYLKDVANQDYVKEIEKRLSAIKVDGILESGQIQKMIRHNTFSLFPEIGVVERSDSSCAALLKGKVCIVVEGSNLVLVMPQVFIEFLDSGDDHYDNIYLAAFNKLLRLGTIFISVTLPSLYVVVVSYHPDILPPQFILSLASSRITVPVNAFFEVTIMEAVAEILKEASIRLPKKIGAAIGIVGTIVIGQAAVAAGLVSPLMVIIVSFATMSSFIAPDFTLMSPIRILKFMMIFFSGAFGLYGFVMGLTIIAIHLTSSSSFGVPYFAPIAPFSFTDLKKQLFSDINLAKKRPEYLDVQDEDRQ